MAKSKGINSEAKGIHKYEVFKLGKSEAKADNRNLKFATLLKAAIPTLPSSYDFDATHPQIPMPMFANDTLGCCVISGRAHQTLRFEFLEQKVVLKIADSDVTKEYFKETGGPDSGLVVLDSLKLWRTTGWKAAGKSYKIKAFSQVTFHNHDEMRQAIYADVGVGIGVQLPLAAQQQTQTGQPWDVTTGPKSVKGSWGGHYVYVPGYTPTGPVCVTWGRKQQMTWAWLEKYCDEAYAIFDAEDSFKKAVIDKSKLNAFLASID